jgi:hypothetical protein
LNVIFHDFTGLTISPSSHYIQNILFLVNNFSHGCEILISFSDGEVFGFKCSAGLLFDVNRQICDFKLNVDNCDVVAGELILN